MSDPDFVKVLPQMAWMILLLGAGFAGLLLVLTASILSLRTGVPSSAVGEYTASEIWAVSWEDGGRALVRRVPTPAGAI